MAHLYRVILPVSDIDRAASYAAVLGSPGRRVSPGRHYFECDGYRAHPIPEPLYFAVSDLPSVYGACKGAGAVFATESPPGVGPLGEITRRSWGEESFYAADPFGNPICFVARASVFTG